MSARKDIEVRLSVTCPVCNNTDRTTARVQTLYLSTEWLETCETCEATFAVRLTPHFKVHTSKTAWEERP